MVLPDNGYGVAVEPENGPVIRYIQDQPLAYWRPNSGGVDADFITFAQKCARFLESIGKLTDRQLAACENSMRKIGWVEPERWEPWFEIVDEAHEYKQHYDQKALVVHICPGTAGYSDEFKAAARDAMTALRVEFPKARFVRTIGLVFEVTTDVDDPRLEPLSADRRRGKRAAYETPCMRMLRLSREHHARAPPRHNPGGWNG
jgi:hypothetical protein